jgi:Rad3-related DNA helicase
MDFSLDERTAGLSVGEFSAFAIGPRSAAGRQGGLWRAQLGTHWHQELRRRAEDETPAAAFEVAIEGRVFHAGWTLTLTGRIDQLLPLPGGGVLLREIKTVMQPLPAPEEDLRAEYPDYFAQLATYAALRRLADPHERVRAELVFVETGSGLAQPLALPEVDDGLFRARLQRVTEFLEQRRLARERRRGLDYRPAFASPRPGQETTRVELTAALALAPIVAFEAPTGFGKTGVLLETALAGLKDGRFSRVLYLTSKSTGQIQVIETLGRMTAPAEAAAPAGPAVSAWHVRNKAEHCINTVFRCTEAACPHLRNLERRWPQSGLARFHLFPEERRDLESLRAAGRAAGICPYEITRTALAFMDVWVGDYNYAFAPRNRGLFDDQPGFDPAETLLILDEAHNLPSRVADAFSHALSADEARALLGELDHMQASAPLRRAWESLTLLLGSLRASDALDPGREDDLADALEQVGVRLLAHPPDYDALAPSQADLLWRIPELQAWLADRSLGKLLWCPRDGEVAFTCLDAGPAIGEVLARYAATILASATLGPDDYLRAALGLNEDLTSGPPPALARVEAHTPWREGAYDVAYDARVDTSYQQRSRHLATTAATIEAMAAAARDAPEGLRGTVVFFPSYRYAESLAAELDRRGSLLRVALQPRLPDLAAQAAWVEESLAFADVLFLVLGSSFAEGIDLLGGRVGHALVVGPALPEVNAVQKARLDRLDPLGRETAVRRVYRLPGLQKVNQALGRLVRAPGQRAKVLLHCRRFLEPAFASLLAPDYQFGETLASDEELQRWLER